VSDRPPGLEGFVPGRHLIDAYGTGGFRFAGMGHVGSILATPRGVLAIEARTIDEISETTLAPLFAEIADAPGSIEFVVFGSGESIAPLPRRLADLLRAQNLRFEAMATGPASRVYNIMLGEDRRVAALLLAAP
jgi:uncharacterized protein